MSKKQVGLIVTLNIFFVFLSALILWQATTRRFNALWLSLESSVGNKVNDIKKSNILALQSSLVQTIATAEKSVVSITISKYIKDYIDDPSQINGPWNVEQQTAKIGWWSGIIVSKKGYILTNKHVVQDANAKYSVTLSDGRIYPVDKIWFDDLLDLAVLKIVDWEGIIPNQLDVATFLPIDTSTSRGQFVLTIGNSLSNYANNVTMGILWWTNKQLTINKTNIYVWLYQTDALVNPGNSGGPFLDINGSVLGITTAIVEGQGIAFALPISKEFVDNTLKSIEVFGKIARPILGIQYLDITPSLKETKKLTVNTGIYIKDVLMDLTASKAGLLIGDVVEKLNGKAITHQLPFLYQLYSFIPGDKISLDIIRNGEALTLSFILDWNAQ